MIRNIVFAGALLAATGTTMSSASAAVYHLNPAFRGAVAHRMPVRQARGFHPAVGYRAPLRQVRFAVPVAKGAYGRIARPASAANRFGRPTYASSRVVPSAQRYRRLAHRRLIPTARPVASVATTQPAQALLGGLLPLVAPPAAVAPARAAVVSRRTLAVAGGQVGGASYYSGGRTASGGFVGAATCAHRWLPFGTRVMVTNLTNARQTMCVVNDRGPFVGGRIVDLSRGAAGVLGMLGSGTAHVRIQVMGSHV